MKQKLSISNKFIRTSVISVLSICILLVLAMLIPIKTAKAGYCLEVPARTNTRFSLLKGEKADFDTLTSVGISNLQCSTGDITIKLYIL